MNTPDHLGVHERCKMSSHQSNKLNYRLTYNLTLVQSSSRCPISLFYLSSFRPFASGLCSRSPIWELHSPSSSAREAWDSVCEYEMLYPAWDKSTTQEIPCWRALLMACRRSVCVHLSAFNISSFVIRELCRFNRTSTYFSEPNQASILAFELAYYLRSRIMKKAWLVSIGCS